jgi:hypothetical protein
MMNPPPMPSSEPTKPMNRPDRQHRQHADIEPAFLEAHPHRQAVDPVVLVGQALAHHDAPALLEQGPHRFLQHQYAHEAEQHEEAEGDDEIELAGIAQQREGRHPAERAQYAGQHQIHRQMQIDAAAPVVAERARGGGGHHLAGHRGHGHRGGHAGKDQQRRQQEAPAHPEQARQEAHRPSDPHEKEEVHGKLGDRQIDLQDPGSRSDGRSQAILGEGLSTRGQNPPARVKNLWPGQASGP